MRRLKKGRMIYVALSVVVLILNALPIIIRGNASMTKYSTIPLAFAMGSIAYAVVAIILKGKGNLFLAGKYWFYDALSLAFSAHESKEEDEKYQKEFVLSAFIYCVTIPTYITLAFFAKEFYSALAQAIWVTILRSVAIIVIVLIPPIIKRVIENKRQRIKDEAERKEQERRESMGKWK